jgi:hypothetical protein
MSKEDKHLFDIFFFGAPFSGRVLSETEFELYLWLLDQCGSAQGR